MSSSKWRKRKLAWVVGCIDSHGAIVAHASEMNRTHSTNESKGKKFRWNVARQDFEDTMGGIENALTDDEYFVVCDWLVKHNYAEDNLF